MKAMRSSHKWLSLVPLQNRGLVLRIGRGVWEIAVAEGGAGAQLAPLPSWGRSYAYSTSLVRMFACKGCRSTTTLLSGGWGVFLWRAGSPRPVVNQRGAGDLPPHGQPLAALLGPRPNYVEMLHRLLQHDTPEDFVTATSHQESVRRFIELAAPRLGWGGIQ